jgi:hypothetical protein
LVLGRSYYRIDKDCAETFEAIGKGTGVMPVTPANISRGLRWDATAVDYYTQEDQSRTCNDLDDGENKLNCGRDLSIDSKDFRRKGRTLTLSIASDTKHLNDN